MVIKSSSLGVGQRALVVIVLAAGVAALLVAVPAGWADAMSLYARWQITQWQSSAAPQPQPGELGLVRNDLVAALRWTPGDGQIYENLGYLYGLRATKAQAIPELQQAMLDESINYYRQATELRPMSAYAWANLALGLQLRGGSSDVMWSAYDRACRYGNREAGVQRILAEIGFSRWEEAGNARQTALIQMIDSAYPHAKGDLLKIAQAYKKEALLAH